MAIIVVLVIVWLASGFYCAAVADSKGHDGISWALGGLFFGFIDRENKTEIKKIRRAVEQLEGKPSDIVDI